MCLINPFNKRLSNIKSAGVFNPINILQGTFRGYRVMEVNGPEAMWLPRSG